MKQWLYTLVALLVGLPALHAQVNAELVLDQEQFLPQESLPVGVRITNLSGKTLRFDTNTQWLRFSVEAYEGIVVNQIAEMPRPEPFTLPTAKRATTIVDLAACFGFETPGRYRVTAILNIPDWDPVVVTPVIKFDIVNGLRVWDQLFGLPPKENDPGQPPARKYILQKVNTMKEIRLYVRLTNPEETKTFQVFRLCPMVSFAQPAAQVDKDANLHVLCQTGARAFMYHVLSSNGELIRRMTYDYANTRPALTSNGEGDYRVTGGKRRATPDDFAPTPDLPGPKIVTPAPTDAPDAKKKKKKDDW